ncbi:MAG: OB-fold domain-containing protein, partial [Chloroflexi bacterium]|nr:OB-fold domain-containing protein [Chloroflexota bacterium]
AYQKAKGTGKIYSMSIVYQNRSPGFKDEVPYIIAYIELDEGIQMFSNVIGAKDPTTVKVGDRVTVTFEDVTPEVTLPKFAVVK